jgi:hypothetical protein
VLLMFRGGESASLKLGLFLKLFMSRDNFELRLIPLGLFSAKF